MRGPGTSGREGQTDLRTSLSSTCITQFITYRISGAVCPPALAPLPKVTVLSASSPSSAAPSSGGSARSRDELWASWSSETTEERSMGTVMVLEGTWLR